jgi:hypothetical protein
MSALPQIAAERRAGVTGVPGQLQSFGANAIPMELGSHAA